MSLASKHISLVSSIGTSIISCSALIGWMADVETLKRISLSQPYMMPVTAVTLLVASVSLGLLSKSQLSFWTKGIGVTAAIFVIFIGALTGCEYLFGIELQFETVFFKKDLALLQTAYAGRPSPHTTLNFFLLGAAMFALYSDKISARRVARILSSAVVLIALIVLIGYAYHASLLYRITVGIGMALHTAVAFIFLGCGVLAASHSKSHPFFLFSESVGGQIARFVLLPAVVLSIFLSGLIMSGAQAGWYEPAYGMAFSAIMSAAVLSVLIWRYAKILNTKNRTQEATIKSGNSLLNQEGILKQLINAQEEERRRIARELHDQIGQYLSAFMLRLKLLKKDPSQTISSKHELSELEKIATQLSDETHRMVWELRPSALDEVGLTEALANYVEQWEEHTGIIVDYQSVGLDNRQISAEIETAVYRVVQEALTNVLRHSEARQVSLIVNMRNSHLNVVVEDNGKGFDVDNLLNDKVAHIGILGIQERVELVGGSVIIESALNFGTTIIARIPLSKEDRENHENITYLHRRRSQNNAGRTQGSNKRTA